MAQWLARDFPVRKNHPSSSREVVKVLSSNLSSVVFFFFSAFCVFGLFYIWMEPRPRSTPQWAVASGPLGFQPTGLPGHAWPLLPAAPSASSTFRAPDSGVRSPVDSLARRPWQTPRPVQAACRLHAGCDVRLEPLCQPGIWDLEF